MSRLPGCECEVPWEGPDPRKKGTCLGCGKILRPEWISSDQTMSEFYNRLEAIFPGPPTRLFLAFRQQCEDRERAGRKKFGHSSLGKDNIAEAREEAADLANYMVFDGLKHRRETGDDDDISLPLTAALHAFRAYEAMAALEGKRAGSV